MKITIVGTKRFCADNQGTSREFLEIRAGAISLARIRGNRVLVGSRIITAATFAEAISRATGCTTKEAATAISEYSESVSHHSPRTLGCKRSLYAE